MCLGIYTTFTFFVQIKSPKRLELEKLKNHSTLSRMKYHITYSTYYLWLPVNYLKISYVQSTSKIASPR